MVLNVSAAEIDCEGSMTAGANTRGLSMAEAMRTALAEADIGAEATAGQGRHRRCFQSHTSSLRWLHLVGKGIPKGSIIFGRFWVDDRTRVAASTSI